MKILVTGAAGFIGSKVASMLLQRGDEVVGIDNINDYYNPQLKADRLKTLLGIDEEGMEWKRMCHSFLYAKGRFMRMDIAWKKDLDSLFETERFDAVVHLAAQAGVRYSIDNPYAYMKSNMEGFLNILEACRHYPVKHLVYASSSSVYGMNSKAPFSENDATDEPVSLYAASKKSNELMAHAYATLYGIATTGLRYFTVYGPWGRPDMAPMLFAQAIMEELPIKVFNHGDMMRDFTYIDDIATGTLRCLDNMPHWEKDARARVYNIGCSQPVCLMNFIEELEQAIGKKAAKQMMPMQQGDVYMTFADTTKLKEATGYMPQTTLHQGIQLFVEWLKSYKSAGTKSTH